MDFRHNAARRRRVMLDDRLEVELSAPLPTCNQPFRRYQTPQVLADQPTLLDVLPKRAWLVGLIVLVLLGCGGLLVLAEHGSGELAESPSVSGNVDWLRPLLSNRHWWSPSIAGSLGQLFVMGLGVLSTILCFQIYHLRRHRGDDYHGAYRIWLWLLPGLGCLAVTNVPVVQEGTAWLGQYLMSNLAAVGLAPSAILAVAIVLLFLVTLRLFYEMRESKSAVAFLLVAALLTGGYLILRHATAVGWDLATEPQAISLSGVPSAATSVWLLIMVAQTSALLGYLGYLHRDVLGLIAHNPVPQTDEAGVAETSPDQTPEDEVNGDHRPVVQPAPAITAGQRVADADPPRDEQPRGPLSERVKRQAAGWEDDAPEHLEDAARESRLRGRRKRRRAA